MKIFWNQCFTKFTLKCQKFLKFHVMFFANALSSLFMLICTRFPHMLLHMICTMIIWSFEVLQFLVEKLWLTDFLHFVRFCLKMVHICYNFFLLLQKLPAYIYSCSLMFREQEYIYIVDLRYDTETSISKPSVFPRSLKSSSIFKYMKTSKLIICRNFAKGFFSMMFWAIPWKGSAQFAKIETYWPKWILFI